MDLHIVSSSPHKIMMIEPEPFMRTWSLSRFLSSYFIFYFISPLFNQVGQLRTSSHLQLRPGQDKAKQCDKNTELHKNKCAVKNLCTMCANVEESEGKAINRP